MFARHATLLPLLVLAVLAPAQAKRELAAVATTTPPKIDGDLGDPTWATAGRATGFTDVFTGGPADEPTEVLISYDDKNLYIAFDCRDSHPESIVGRDTVRDSKFQKNGEPNTEDNVEVDIDPFLSRRDRDRSRFSVNPLGTPSAVFAGGRGQKAEWTGEWEAAAKRTASGWSAEMRIPWASLNYPTSQPKITMGVNFFRYVNRTKRLQEWSREGQQGFTENEGLWTGVQVPQAAFRPELSVLPYVLGRATDDGFVGKTGADIRYPITPQLTAVGTINPDFSNIEGALRSITFSSTEVFIPEYRPFFLEGGDYFDIPWGANGMDIYFYSRRIPRFDLGGKLYGKKTPEETIGFLDTYSYDGRNDFVARYQRNLNVDASAGVMVVGKDAPDDKNTVALFDQHFRHGKFGADSVVGTSTGKDAGGGMEAISAFYSDKILTTILHLSEKSFNFRNANGLIPLLGYKGYWFSEIARYDWKKGPFSGASAVFNSVEFTRADGSPYDRELTGSLNLYTRNDWRIGVDAQDVLFEGLRDRTVGTTIVMGQRNRFRQIGIRYLTGETGSVPTTFWGPRVTLRLFNKMDLLYSGAIQVRNGKQQQHVLTLNYELSPTRSFGGRWVSEDKATNAYLYYRNSGGKGTEYYFTIGDPNAKRTVRSLQLKVVFAF